jgi:putative endopeptidase
MEITLSSRTVFRPLIIAGIALSFALPCTAAPKAQASADGPQPGAWGVDLTGMDTSVKPGDDLYKYVNGTWDATTGIPADKKDIGPAAEPGDLAFEQVKALLEEDAADPNAPKGSESSANSRR